MAPLRLGVNIDHVATLRNARGGHHPDPVHAARLIESAGGDGITAHLREDRRHIRDADVFAIKDQCSLPLNFEMALTDEMIGIASKLKPHACCIVPERREERTTEHGLNVRSHLERIKENSKRLQDLGIRVSLFVDPDLDQIAAAHSAGADIVEIHTGTYGEASDHEKDRTLAAIIEAAERAHALGLEVHAGHGLDVDNVVPVAAINVVQELNIGHSLIGDAVFLGFVPAVRRMRDRMDEARS